MSVQEKLVVGEPTLLALESGSQPVGAFFEDDGDTGYFYAIRLPDHQILDAVQIYDVASVVNRSLESEVEILWSSDGLKAALLINRYPHAVFDFSAKRGYCRMDFPNFSSGQDDAWYKDSHRWDDAVMGNFGY